MIKTGDEMSNTITYRRKMKLEYKAMPNLDKAKFAFALQENGLNLTHRWAERIEYGYVLDKKTWKEYEILSPRGKLVYTDKFQTIRNGVFDQLSGVYKVRKRTVVKVSEQAEWVKPQGQTLVADKNILSDATGVEYCLMKHHSFEDDVKMLVTLTTDNWTDKLTLGFEVDWDVKSVKSKNDIEKHVVDIPLKDMAIIQDAVEKTFADVGEVLLKDPTINCTFEALTMSKSECSPDTISKLRVMRDSVREEEEEE